MGKPETRIRDAENSTELLAPAYPPATGRAWFSKPLAVASFLLVLIAVFLYRNILEARPAIPFDLLYRFDPWKSGVSTATPVQQNPELFDQVVQLYPWWKLIVDEMTHGRFPLWNPFSFCGSPLFANGQSGVFYPLQLLNFIFSPLVASILLSCARLLLAGVFTWAYLRQLGVRAEVSFFGAVAFTFSGNIIVWLGFPAANAAVLVPALFWACERLLKRGSAGNFIMGAVLIAVQFFAGQPQTSLVSGFALSIYIALRLAGDTSPLTQRARTLLLYAGSWALGACLAAVQILPMMEYMKESAAWAFRSQFNLKAYPWYELVSFVIPDFFGTPYQENYWGFANLVGTACYVGVTPMILALMSLTSVRRQAHLRCFWAIALVCLGVIYQVPLLRLVTSLPLFNATDTNKFLVVIVFSLVVCSALELHQILEGVARRPAPKGLLAFGVLLGVALVACLYFREFLIALSLEYYEAKNLAIFLTSALATMLLLGARDHRRPGGSAVCGLLIGVLYIDLFIFGHSYNAAAPRDKIAEAPPPAVARLRQDLEGYRLLGVRNTLPPNTSILYGAADVRGYDALTPRRYFNFLSRAQPDYQDLLRTLDLNERPGEEAPITRSTLFKREARRMLSGRAGDDLRRLLQQAYYWNTDLDGLVKSNVLDAFSVRFVLAPQDVKTLPGSGLRFAGGEGVSVFENPDALPRSYLRRDFTITDESSALQIAAQPDFDFRQRLLLSGVADPEAFQKPFAAAEYAAVEDRAVIVHQDSSLVEISAQAGGPRVLVLTDLYFPGWEGYIDGRRVPVYAANYLFRAVLLPQAGNHTIRFTYNPASFVMGAAISIAAALVCIVLLISVALRYRMRSTLLVGRKSASEAE